MKSKVYIVQIKDLRTEEVESFSFTSKVNMKSFVDEVKKDDNFVLRFTPEAVELEEETEAK